MLLAPDWIVLLSFVSVRAVRCVVLLGWTVSCGGVSWNLLEWCGHFWFVFHFFFFHLSVVCLQYCVMTLVPVKFSGESAITFFTGIGKSWLALHDYEWERDSHMCSKLDNAQEILSVDPRTTFPSEVSDDVLFDDIFDLIDSGRSWHKWRRTWMTWSQKEKSKDEDTAIVTAKTVIHARDKNTSELRLRSGLQVSSLLWYLICVSIFWMK